MQLKTLFAGLITLTIIGAPTLVRADEPGRHPSYLHARTDLRTAQMLMRVDDPDPKVMRNLREAAENVEAAIHEIDRASVIDGKNLEDHPRVDAIPDRAGRLHRIRELLRQGRADLGREEDDSRARGWRNAAYGHIDEAVEHINRLIDGR